MYRKGADELAAARAELVSYGTRLLDDGLAAGSAGNLSVRMGELAEVAAESRRRRYGERRTPAS